MPEMTYSRNSISFFDAFFTSLSASCVTGLIVLDTATYFTQKGHIILMLLIQLGGLNIISFATLFAVFSRKGLGIKHQSIIHENLSSDSLFSSKGLVRKIFFFSLFMEIIGAILLYYNWNQSPEFNQMKDGVIFVNLSRGFVVDIPALIAAQNSGKVAGVAVDVYPIEPKSNDEPFINELMGQPNTILTPHIGGSTMEAQKHIGNFVPTSLMSYINTGASFDSVNLPQIKIVPQKNGHRFLHIHKNVSGVLAQVNNILAKYEMNITGQHLKTDEKIGYLITDVDKEYNKEVIEELRAITETIKFRLLY